MVTLVVSDPPLDVFAQGPEAVRQWKENQAMGRVGGAYLVNRPQGGVYQTPSGPVSTATPERLPPGSYYAGPPGTIVPQEIHPSPSGPISAAPEALANKPQPSQPTQPQVQPLPQIVEQPSFNRPQGTVTNLPPTPKPQGQYPSEIRTAESGAMQSMNVVLGEMKEKPYLKTAAEAHLLAGRETSEASYVIAERFLRPTGVKLPTPARNIEQIEAGIVLEAREFPGITEGALRAIESPTGTIAIGALGGVAFGAASKFAAGTKLAPVVAKTGTGLAAIGIGTTGYSAGTELLRGEVPEAMQTIAVSGLSFGIGGKLAKAEAPGFENKYLTAIEQKIYNAVQVGRRPVENIPFRPDELSMHTYNIALENVPAKSLRVSSMEGETILPAKELMGDRALAIDFVSGKNSAKLSVEAIYPKIKTVISDKPIEPQEFVRVSQMVKEQTMTETAPNYIRAEKLTSISSSPIEDQYVKSIVKGGKPGDYDKFAKAMVELGNKYNADIEARATKALLEPVSPKELTKVESLSMTEAAPKKFEAPIASKPMSEGLEFRTPRLSVQGTKRTSSVENEIRQLEDRQSGRMFDKLQRINQQTDQFNELSQIESGISDRSVRIENELKNIDIVGTGTIVGIGIEQGTMQRQLNEMGQQLKQDKIATPSSGIFSERTSTSNRLMVTLPKPPKQDEEQFIPKVKIPRFRIKQTRYESPSKKIIRGLVE